MMKTALLIAAITISIAASGQQFHDDNASSESITLGFGCSTTPSYSTTAPDDMRKHTLATLLDICIHNRLTDITRSPDCHILFFRFDNGCMADGSNAFAFNISPREGHEAAAFRELCIEVERLRRHGLTNDELTRAEKNHIRTLKRRTHGSASNDELSFCNELFRHLKVSELNALIAEYLPYQDRNTYIEAKGLGTSSCPHCKMPAEDQLAATYRAVRDSDIGPDYYKRITCRIVDNEPAAGHIVTTMHNKEIDATEITLSNGVKVVIRSNYFEEDRIDMMAISNGGESRYTGNDLINAQVADLLVSDMGVGIFSPATLNKILSDNGVDFSGPSIERYYESMSGSSRSESFETLLQANFLYFTSPRRDENIFTAFIENQRSGFELQRQDQSTEFTKRFDKLLNGKKNNITLNESTIAKVTLDRVLEIYNERYANPADFTFYIVGNIDADDQETLTLIAKWIGGMTTNDNREVINDNTPSYRKGVRRSKFKYPTRDRKATTEVTLTGYGFDYTLANATKAKMLSKIISNRLNNITKPTKINTFCFFDDWICNTHPVLHLDLEFTSSPDEQKLLLQLIYAEINSMITRGLQDAELTTIRQELLRGQGQGSNNSVIITRTEAYYQAGIIYDRDYANTVNNITPEEIRLFLRSLFTQDNRIELVMMPR